jgi:hypothetical protein
MLQQFGRQTVTDQFRCLIAICHVHDVAHLKTFKVTHFARFAGLGPGLVFVDPAGV